MLINEKGRIFGLINIIDLIVIILIAFLAFGFFYHQKNTATAETRTATVKVICPYLRPEVAEQIHEGDQLMARGQLQPVYVKELRVEIGNTSAVNSEGKVVLQKHPFRKDVWLSLEGPISTTGDEIYMAGQEIRAGRKKYLVKTQLFEVEGEILEVDIH